MAIWLDENSKIIVQGMTGSEGTKHTRRMVASGAQVVGGVNAKKAGEEVDGIELAKLATAIEPDLVVVFMTGYSASMRTLQELGERTLAKPFSRQDLYVALAPFLADDPEAD